MTIVDVVAEQWRLTELSASIKLKMQAAVITHFKPRVTLGALAFGSVVPTLAKDAKDGAPSMGMVSDGSNNKDGHQPMRNS
jgi:hypothetical protein